MPEPEFDQTQFWHEISFDLPATELQRAEDTLFAAGALSITLKDAADQPLLEPAPGETPTWDNAIITGLFDSAQNADSLLAELSAALVDTACHSLRYNKLANQCWERSWLEHFKPMLFGQRLWICPSHITPESILTEHTCKEQQHQDEPVVIMLDPGMAFGTGTHPTTALCLAWLDSQDLHDKSCLDYGCGSGILAIAAAKLGAPTVYAADIDPQAVTATQWNTANNSVAELIQISDCEALPDVQTDVVLANILANILIDLSANLADRVAPGGKLILSGILSEQAETVMTSFEKWFSFAAPKQLEDWVLLEGQKKSKD